MTDPLSSNEDRKPNEKLELDHFKRSRVTVAHQVTNKPTIVPDRSRAFPVGDSRRLDDGGVVPHVIDEHYVAVPEHRVLHSDLALRFGDDGTGHRRFFDHVAREGLEE